MGRRTSSRDGQESSILSMAAIVAAAGATVVAYSYARRKWERSHWQETEERDFGHDTLPSIIEHFRDFRLSLTSTVKEANHRRTGSYYLKARQAHSQSLVLGCTPYRELISKRYDELETLLSYYHQGNKSHRTVVVMLDRMTQEILSEARTTIFGPLDYSSDPTTRGVWIPAVNLIPKSDMHVTVAIPWWWHTMRDGNRELSQALAHRFRQALILDFHHPFQVELERIILLGGKTLVALWRTIGSRTTEDGTVIEDRHGEGIDPMVRLRREIVKCFTTEKEEIGRMPLTYHSHKKSLLDGSTSHNNLFAGSTPLPVVTTIDSVSPGAKPLAKSQSLPIRVPMPIPRPTPIKERETTIESKTPGLGQGDGFIHTTLCRLPLNCFSGKDVELEPIHRLCREATATYAGHRMLVRHFRFIETTGQGGESNPCVAPIFDETMEAPSKVVVDAMGQVNVVTSGNNAAMANGTGNGQLRNIETIRPATIGALPDLNGGGMEILTSMDSLFDKPDSPPLQLQGSNISQQQF